MMNAYSKDYLPDAMKNLGEAFDWACYCENLPPEKFMRLFINSGVASMFGRGNPEYINMPGEELVFEVLSRSGREILPCERDISGGRTPEYWTGWILAYYQWRSGKTFEYINRFLPADEVTGMYYPLHEAHESKFVDIADNLIKSRDNKSRLQEIRKYNGLSQRELSEKSGVNIRTIQQYENRSKDIGKAQSNILLALSRALNSRMEDLLM